MPSPPGWTASLSLDLLSFSYLVTMVGAGASTPPQHCVQTDTSIYAQGTET